MLKLKIHFVSGKDTILTAPNYKPDEFEKWLHKNLNNDRGRVQVIVNNDGCIFTEHIERIDIVNE